MEPSIATLKSLPGSDLPRIGLFHNLFTFSFKYFCPAVKLVVPFLEGFITFSFLIIGGFSFPLLGPLKYLSRWPAFHCTWPLLGPDLCSTSLVNLLYSGLPSTFWTLSTVLVTSTLGSTKPSLIANFPILLIIAVFILLLLC